MNIPKNTTELVLHFEGFYAKPYLCPAQVPTIGYGTIRYPNGKRVTLNDPPITKIAAIEFMEAEIMNNLNQTIQMCPILLKTSENWLGSIVDFVYNLGIGRLQTSTLRRKINAQCWEDVPTELNKWVYGGGKKLKGLVFRRQMEANFFV